MTYYGQSNTFVTAGQPTDTQLLGLRKNIITGGVKLGQRRVWTNPKRLPLGQGHGKAESYIVFENCFAGIKAKQNARLNITSNERIGIGGKEKSILCRKANLTLGQFLGQPKNRVKK